MGRSASLFGVLGLVFLAFGFVAAALLRTVADPYVLLNLVAGAALVLAYLAFGFEGFRAALGARSTRYGASAALYTVLFLALAAGDREHVPHAMPPCPRRARRRPPRARWQR